MMNVRLPFRSGLIAALPLIAAAFLAPAPAQAQTSMYSDFKAHKAGDILTVILAERTAAARESGWQNKSNSNVGGSGTVSGGTSLSGAFGVDAKFSKDAKNSNESVQSDLLRGTMTAMVASLDQTGNLLIQGERSLNVNGETHLMKVTGIVRPYDVRQDNTIMSYQIANANIEYRRAGGLKRSLFKPGRLARLGVVAVLGAATFFAVSN